MVDGQFFGHLFWKVEGTVHIHINSRVANVWLPYTVIHGLMNGSHLEQSKMATI